MNTTQPFRDDFVVNHQKGRQTISLVINLIVFVGVCLELITHFSSYSTVHIAIQSFNCSLLLLTLFLFVLDREKYYSLNYLIVSYDLVITIILSTVFFNDFFETSPFSARDAFTRNVLPILCTTAFVGFISGRIHVVIQGVLMTLLVTYQVFVVRDPFIVKNAFMYYFAICGFVSVMYYMVGILQKFTFQLKGSYDEIHNLQNLSIQKKEKLQQYNQSLIDLSRRSVFIRDGVSENSRMFKVIATSVYQNLRCSRVSIWLLSKDKEFIYRKALVSNGDFDGSSAELRREDFPDYFQAMQSKPFILAPDALTNKSTRELAEVYLKPLSITSMLDCPIKLNKEVIGVLCCEYQYGTKEWEHEDVLFSQSVADHIAIHLMNMDSQALLLSIKDKNKEILDSITSAKRLQSAILPPSKLVEKYLVNSFIIYQPKDIVAGDFYWMEVIEDYIIFALADCTGHGVPGAMVSVVCHNALNRAVRDYKLLDPGEILNKTRDIVIEQFEQSEESVSDGMDISLCVYDRKKNLLRWAGANSPLLVMSEGQLLKLKPDKQPVGKFTNVNSFTSVDVAIKKGDIIYMYSDGYIDQFGGVKQEKLKYKKLCEFINVFHGENMSTQKQMFESAFEQWKGDNEQVDDMCMIGVKFED